MEKQLKVALGPEYVENISSPSLKKTSDQRKLRQTKCILFNFLMIKITVIPKKKPFGTCQFGKFGVLINFIIQKLKSKHLVCLSFPWSVIFFEGTRGNIFHIFRALYTRKSLNGTIKIKDRDVSFSQNHWMKKVSAKLAQTYLLFPIW